jgi:putative oxidoreductase
LFLIFGFLTRVSALGILGVFTGVTLMHLQNGFFMNWTGSQSGEGIEYFVLLFGLAITSLIVGGGKASVDYALIKNN